MHVLKFNNFSLSPTDFAIYDDLLAFDVCFCSKESFDKFDSFYVDHIDDENSFDFQIDDSTYHGRFGALIYDLEYNARFYMTIAPVKPSYTTYKSAFEYNAPEVLMNHEKRLNFLIDILKSKGIINDDDASNLSSYLTTTENGIDIQRQVKCLSDYLKANQSTLDDIRNEITED